MEIYTHNYFRSGLYATLCICICLRQVFFHDTSNRNCVGKFVDEFFSTLHMFLIQYDDSRECKNYKKSKLWYFKGTHFHSSTYQYCHIFRACNGRLQMAKVSTTMISIRTTPRLARSTLFDGCDTVTWRTAKGENKIERKKSHKPSKVNKHQAIY